MVGTSTCGLQWGSAKAATSSALGNIKGVKKLVDDILICAPNDETLLKRIKTIFTKCAEWGITLAKSKFQYGNSVKFAGSIVDENGSRPDPEKVSSIKNFPSPKNITDLRSFMGLTNQFSAYALYLKHAMVPLQELLKKSQVYQWMPEYQEAFDKIKDLLTMENGPDWASDTSLPRKMI